MAEADVLVPMSEEELRRKILAIFKHQSQKDKAPFPGPDEREFWQRVEERNRGTAAYVDKLGLPAYFAMEAYVVRKDGKPIDRNYQFINRVLVTYAGREVAQFDTSQSISENPFFTFAVRATEPGQLKVTFLDTRGGKYEGTADIKVS